MDQSSRPPFDNDRVVALEQRTARALEELAEKFAKDVRDLREDALRESIEQMSVAVSGRLAGIESRLAALEQRPIAVEVD